MPRETPRIWSIDETPRRRRMPSTETALMSMITEASPGPFTPAAETLVISNDRASAKDRVSVYAYMYRARVAEALESQFPKLARLLGCEEFAGLSFAYVTDHPSRRPSLRHLGTHLPDWLEQKRPRAPWLADLARLEWARTDVFDVRDEQVLTIDDLRAWPQEEFMSLPLKLIAAHRIVTVDYAVADFWKQIGDDGGPDVADESEDPAGESLLVWRQDASVYHRIIGQAERGVLELVVQGATFGGLCESLPSWRTPEEGSVQAFSWLWSWTTDGLLVSVG